MNILLISYGEIEYDGRLIELWDIAKRMGNVTVVCCGNEIDSPNVFTIKYERNEYLSLKNYLRFIFKILYVLVSQKKFDLIILDNYLVAPIGVFLKKIFPKKKFIQDVRELYIYEDIKSIKGKLMIFSEIKLMKLVDVVLAANKYRSEIMFEKYKLDKKPLIFENIRFLPKKREKYNIIHENIINTDKVNIISTGGLSVSRRTDELVKAMSTLSQEFHLTLIGSGTSNDLKVLNEIIESESLSNVTILGKVPLDELYLIVKKCDIGIVNYHKDDLNNQYCASGKIYEYLDLGLPIVTTENIPLKDFVNNNSVGVADDIFSNGILEVSKNLIRYKENVKTFMNKISVNEYNKQVSRQLLKELESEKNENN